MTVKKKTNIKQVKPDPDIDKKYLAHQNCKKDDANITDQMLKRAGLSAGIKKLKSKK